MPARILAAGAACWLPLALALVTAAAFAPALHNGFTDWDDPGYVTENHIIRDFSLHGLQAMFRTYVEGNYHPVTMASLALDYHLSKLKPSGYHMTNVILHVLDTLAVFWLVLLLTGSRALSGMTSLFFGIHPLHVESVAWVSGRKDVLYALFYFAACISYVQWLRGNRRSAITYGAALALFALSLLSKGMAVTLPLALLAIDFYLKRSPKLKSLLVEKIPFLLLALAFGLVAVVAQESKGAVQEIAAYPWHERLLFACYGISAYWIRAVVPVTLSAFYPYPLRDGGLPITYYVAPVFVLILAGAVVRSLRIGREIAFGALFFLANVALVLQLFPVGSAILADRYTYVSYVGVGFVFAFLFRLLIRKVLARQRMMRAAALALLSAFGITLFFAARARCEIWKDNISLWSDVMSHCPTLTLAYTKRARSYMLRGENDRAMADAEKALSLDPSDDRALTMRGTLRFLRGDNRGALADLEKSVTQNPSDPVSRNSRGAVLFSLGEPDRALADFNRAIELRKDFGEAYLNRALVLSVRGQFGRAMPDYDAAITFQPGNAKAYLWRGSAKLELGDTTGTIEDYSEALRIDPKLGDAYFARSRAFAGLRRYDEAMRDAIEGRMLGYPVSEEYLARLRSAMARPGSR